MFEIIIKQSGQDDALGKLIPGAYLIGSEQDCPIQFVSDEISGHHAQLNVKGKQFCRLLTSTAIQALILM